MGICVKGHMLNSSTYENINIAALNQLQGFEANHYFLIELFETGYHVQLYTFFRYCRSLREELTKTRVNFRM